MAAIFAECRRVLKPDGIMVAMFTHKASGAWDALASGLVRAGFVITASWPVNTEAEGSLHIKEKSAARSTIFLVCRVREERPADADAIYWEEVEPRVAEAVRRRIGEFQEAGIGGIDLYLASFGPALQVFSESWPLTRGRPVTRTNGKKKARAARPEDDDPDAVGPRTPPPQGEAVAARPALGAAPEAPPPGLRRERAGAADPTRTGPPGAAVAGGAGV